MKVLYIINNLGSGGAEKLLEDLIPLMNKEKDVKADILLLTDKNNVFYDSILKKGVKVDIIKYKNIYDPRNILEIKKYIHNGNYDIVHSHLFPTQYWVALTRVIYRNKKVKFITTEHSTYNRRREKLYFRPIDKFIYSKYDTIISITKKTRDNLIDWIDPKRKRADKHIVMENGVDLEKFKKALPYKKNDLVDGIDEDTKLVCMVGRFSEAKDQPTLIKAISKLQDNVHLVLVGEGPLINDNIELVNKLGISDRVHFLGFRQDVSRILKTVDIVVLSSNWEGFGLAAVEGMAAEKPVIVSDVEGLNDVIEDKDLKFELGNYNDLENKIFSLLHNDDMYHCKVSYSNKRCAKFDVKQMVKELFKLYKDEYI
ncbi:glycosyltransferase [Caldisalinibacter kiritimatiensis]|uniref:Glycosyltransferase n=1 Tax=Caldisalinibacter kiritimatiensis TaxID=1304284 RepID=R1CTT9_9FIRM|nr:glycosyltransferase [Caldisalinibacter kiritimatiensis]EOD00104.1 Glycosyltransferase [Caldisalinibacter kiritimatiensis]